MAGEPATLFTGVNETKLAIRASSSSKDDVPAKYPSSGAVWATTGLRMTSCRASQVS
ncbi:Uncharacterised protein [Mycobacteroides abscessus subsp. abscessus]|nr:Uncharacterised protein [Mycobacteroides abscessus subsp. abscessus]